MIIRKMTEGDRAHVKEMMRVFYSSPAVHTSGSEEIFDADVSECVGDSPYLEGYVFDENEKIMGYSMIAKSFSTEFGKPCAWVEDIYILEEARGRGYATEFFKFVDEKYKGYVIRLEADADNESALRVYRRAGFSEMPYLELKKEAK